MNVRRAALVVAAVVAASSVLVVTDPADVGIVYRFGRVDRTLGAGLGVRLPPPIERVESLRVTEMRRVALPRTRYLTGDTNLVELETVVQYTVADPVAFATRFSDPDAVVAAQVAAAAAAAVARTDIDTLLSAGRARLSQDVLSAARGALEAVGAGVTLVAVDIADLAPPAAVLNAFNDVASARGDGETTSLAANGYASKLLPEVRGRAAARVEAARADAAGVAAAVDADIARFEALRAGWKDAPASVRARLRADALQAVGQAASVRVLPAGSTLQLPEAP